MEPSVWKSMYAEVVQLSEEVLQTNPDDEAGKANKAAAAAWYGTSERESERGREGERGGERGRDRDRDRDRDRESECVCMCACMCVPEREREIYAAAAWCDRIDRWTYMYRETNRDRERERGKNNG